MQICVGVHSSCPFLGWECGKFKGVFPARARPARRRKKPNRTAAHNSHSAPSSRGAGSPPPASAWSGCLTGRPARPQSAPLGRAARVILWRYAGCSIFRRGRRCPAGECPRRDGERPLIPPESGVFGGQAGRKRETGGDTPPNIIKPVEGRFSRGSRGAGSPPPASARPAPRSPESARGANSPNALARARRGQPRTAQQGKRFSVRPLAFGGFGRMRGRAGRVRGSAAGFAARAQA